MGDPRVRKAEEQCRSILGIDSVTPALAELRAGLASVDKPTLDHLIEKFESGVYSVSRDAIKVVRDCVIDELQLPWPWVTLALTGLFRARAVSLATGAEFSFAFTSTDPGEAPVPPVSVQSMQGETIAAFEARVKALLAETRAATALPKGRSPKGEGEAIARFVTWYYRCKLKSPADSVSAVARTAQVHRRAVQYGIEQANRMLGLTVAKY